jgi:hypothetical protein
VLNPRDVDYFPTLEDREQHQPEQGRRSIIRYEYISSFVGLFVLLVLFAVSSFYALTALGIFVSLLSIVAGSMMIFLGFWGSDYAMSIALGELDQSSKQGRIRGVKGMVYVPFVGNYTPTEWWNLNWYITLLGAAILALGMFMLGLHLAVSGILK